MAALTISGTQPLNLKPSSPKPAVHARVAALPLSGAAHNLSAPAVVVRDDGAFRRDERWRGTGVAVPVFSLRTRVGGGCRGVGRGVGAGGGSCRAFGVGGGRVQGRVGWCRVLPVASRLWGGQCFMCVPAERFRVRG